ncbi:tRNA (adenosine(37)-N6)-threonylcarbamoyltransferase complex dimerization subunit type 1 TsaB [Indiicoccus explosivorum]|uniref:tRNA (adenosine(37)-N6)-threonylcarbamoyltransferase complex dimerization subunit type 1 TsaB n=1 Tax=Indiicoccus explosivorum TaxID=1917864 RepID=UPI000B43569E|nr:tRNA (adenosine(37)-N6)-threonylcarbamoyltransferase complex dimerization subunit type 1 TsaB [Indiicoccus explosivorum]
MTWLGIDTSNSPLAVGLVKDGVTLIEETSNLKINHSLTAMPAVESLLHRASLKPGDLTHIAVAQGPGSYTGVRIGMTIAKTLAWSLGLPLVPVSSLKILAANGRYFNGMICPIIDARRGTVYAGTFKGPSLLSAEPEAHQELSDLLGRLETAEGTILFAGSDASQHEETIRNALGDRALFLGSHNRLPRASELIRLAMEETPVNAHAAVPEYRRLAEAEANYLKARKGPAT